jgi:hypothetical protein
VHAVLANHNHLGLSRLIESRIAGIIQNGPALGQTGHNQDWLQAALQHVRREGEIQNLGGNALETCAAATLQRLLSDWGESHLREVLLSIVESAGNERSLIAPVIWAVSDILLAHPNWFGCDWLAALDEINLSNLHESAKLNRKAVEPRAAIAAVLFERLKDGLPVTRRLLYQRSRGRQPASASTAKKIIRARSSA